MVGNGCQKTRAGGSVYGSRGCDHVGGARVGVERVAHVRDDRWWVQTTGGDLRLLGIEFLLVPDDAYEYRGPNGLQITSTGFVPQLRKAEETGSVAFWVHTHPGEGSNPAPSPRDDIVNAQIGPLFRLRTGEGRAQ